MPQGDMTEVGEKGEQIHCYAVHCADTPCRDHGMRPLHDAEMLWLMSHYS